MDLLYHVSRSAIGRLLHVHQSALFGIGRDKIYNILSSGLPVLLAGLAGVLYEKRVELSSRTSWPKITLGVYICFASLALLLFSANKVAALQDLSITERKPWWSKNWRGVCLCPDRIVALAFAGFYWQFESTEERSGKMRVPCVVVRVLVGSTF